jgi:hypothetical protein
MASSADLAQYNVDGNPGSAKALQQQTQWKDTVIRTVQQPPITHQQPHPTNHHKQTTSNGPPHTTTTTTTSSNNNNNRAASTPKQQNPPNHYRPPTQNSCCRWAPPGVVTCSLPREGSCAGLFSVTRLRPDTPPVSLYILTSRSESLVRG